MAERFGWIGESRRDRVAEAVLALVREWSGDWAMGAREWTVVPTRDAARDATHDTDSPMAALATSGDVASFLVGFEAGEASGLVAHVTSAAVRALLGKLSGETPNAVVSSPLHGLPPSLCHGNLGAVHLCLASGSFHVDVWLARLAVDRLAPPATARTETLVPRHGAIEHAPVHLRTELDLGAITLGDIRHLRPGDVIATSTPLDAYFDVVEQEKGRTLFAASLGARGNRRAIRIVASRG